MPAYEFSGPDSRYYPEGRDASGRLLGNVEPGDIRILDEPPADGQWTPLIPPRADEDRGGTESDPDPADVPGGDPGEQPGETPGPQPAPPAVIPGA